MTTRQQISYAKTAAIMEGRVSATVTVSVRVSATVRVSLVIYAPKLHDRPKQHENVVYIINLLHTTQRCVYIISGYFLCFLFLFFSSYSCSCSRSL